MKILGINFGNKIQKELSEVKKKLQEYQKLRPEDKLMRTTQNESGARVPFYPIPEEYLYSLALNSDITRIAINTLSLGIFRRGLDLKQKDNSNPNNQEKQLTENFIESMNENNQSMIDVLKQLEEDVDILDKIYLVAIKKYYTNNSGEIVDKFTEVKEFIRADPLSMNVIADRENRLGYTKDGQQVYISIDNRNKLIPESQAKAQNYLSKTGKKLYVACYVAKSKDKKIYYLRDEVLYLTKSSGFYGYSKLFSVWQKIVTLNEMDRFLRLAYHKQRAPRGLLTISTTNFESLKKAWEQLKAETMKDPHSINPLLYENPKGNGVQFIDFMKPLSEMQYIDTRNEMRRLILAIYGVTPVFSGDVSTSGGLNNEGNQIYGVTNKALEDGQQFYNQKVIKWILKQLNIQTLDLVLKVPEEDNETENLQMMKIKMDNAYTMSQMGFQPEWIEEEKDFKFPQKPVVQGSSSGSGSNSNSPSTQTFLSPSIPTKPQTISSNQKGFESLKQSILNKRIENGLKKYIEADRNQLKKQGIEFNIEKAMDEQFIKYIKLAFFNKEYSKLSKNISEKINQIILKGILTSSSVDTLIQQVQDLGVDEGQADVIIRTEQQALQNKVREFNYKNAKGSSNFKYEWIGPNDQRTTQVCKNIVRRTQSGVEMKKLKQIIKEESIKGGFDGTREFTPHFSCRHSFIRRV